MTSWSDSDLALRLSEAYSLPSTVQPMDNVRAVVDGSLVLVPGTTDLPGWERDFDGVLRSFSGLGWLHSGFGVGGVALWEAVQPILPKTSGRLTIVGHSLGGALAQVMAMKNDLDGRPPCELVTFGSPRFAMVGNLIAWKAMRAAVRCVRYVRVGDPVPGLPAFGLYAHSCPATVLSPPLLSGSPMVNHNLGPPASSYWQLLKETGR